MTMTSLWSPAHYLQFADHRTRPAIDLLSMVPNRDPLRITDLGCGPGNSTEILVDRSPNAFISGTDSSPQMIEAARKRLPKIDFSVSRIEDWAPAEPQDVIFANAVLQWLPEHGEPVNSPPYRLDQRRNCGHSNAGQFE